MFGVLAPYLDVAELHVRDGPAPDEEGGADAGPGRENEDDAVDAAPGAPTHLRQSRRVRVVDRADGHPEFLLQRPTEVEPDGRLVYVGGRVHHAVLYHGRATAPDRPLPVRLPDHARRRLHYRL